MICWYLHDDLQSQRKCWISYKTFLLTKVTNVVVTEDVETTADVVDDVIVSNFIQQKPCLHE